MQKSPDDGDCPKCGTELIKIVHRVEGADGELVDERRPACPSCNYAYHG